MSLVNTIVAFIVALGVLIVVHEYGHYLVARLCGVKVLRFSVGFGRALLVRRTGKDRTEWVVAAVPFGGYVKMLDEREGPVAEHEAHRAFNRQGVWKRIAIVVAEKDGQPAFYRGTARLGPTRMAAAQPAPTTADVDLLEKQVEMRNRMNEDQYWGNVQRAQQGVEVERTKK